MASKIKLSIFLGQGITKTCLKIGANLKPPALTSIVLERHDLYKLITLTNNILYSPEYVLDCRVHGYTYL